MKIFLPVLGLFIYSSVISQITLIPDENFEGFLLSEGIDTDGALNGQVSTVDIETVIELYASNENIEDFTGIEDFAALEILDCSENSGLESINLSTNTMLKEFYAEFTSLSTLDISTNSSLQILYIPHNNLTTLTLENNPALEALVCGNPMQDVGPFNEITSIDLAGAPNLLFLDVSYMFINVDFDLTLLPLLENFYGAYSGLESLDFSNNQNLEVLDLGGFETGLVFGQSNNLTELNLSNNPNLTDVNVGFTGISSLNLRNGNNTILTEMRANLNDPLFCIQVDDETAANNGDVPYGDWNVDAQATYSEECILGIEENKLALFTLYPNPTSQHLRIESSSNMMLQGIQIYSVEGQLLLEPNFNNGSMDVSELASGFYILKAQFDESVSSQTFIKK